MAEKVAHLAQTLHIKPSLFDFIAQESLDSQLCAAIRRVVNFLSSNNDKFKFLSKYFTEIYYTGHLFLQLHYLKQFGATFTENFYGLKRVALQNPSSHLTKKELILSLLFCSVVPYLRHKLFEVADKIEYDLLPLERKKRKIQLLKSVLWLNQNINISIQIIFFVQYIRYLSGKSDIISPFLWASRLKLEYSQEQNETSEFSLRNFIPQVLRSGFEVSAFFLQFCQWWQTEKVGGLNNLPIPPPPEVTEKGKEFAGICPICGGKRISETVLRVSGYVFCFKCISNYLGKHKRCPITNLPANMNNLTCLYPPH
ncbi:UNVERIFIED_CONTAM: hypothetical protein PYX00_007547 [Menopon gallinae]|uniref:Peroxisome assembly protein 12 n=1 Tax=Menopon gallinae TaxID=328185 RepID=A0AAW2HJJ9_9NEOP